MKKKIEPIDIEKTLSYCGNGESPVEVIGNKLNELIIAHNEEIK